MCELLMANPHHVIPTERFLEKIWGCDSDAEITVVWVYVSYLRKKAGRPARRHSDQGPSERRVFAGGSAMIRRLRLKFSLLLTGSLLALFAVIVTSMNVINYHAVVREADQTLALLVGNEGRFPDLAADKGGHPPHDMPPELPYESRYFSVLLDGDGGVLRTDTSRISAVDDASAVEYARTVLRDGGEQGFEGAIPLYARRAGRRLAARVPRLRAVAGRLPAISVHESGRGADGLCGRLAAVLLLLGRIRVRLQKLRKRSVLSPTPDINQNAADHHSGQRGHTRNGAWRKREPARHPAADPTAVRN